VASDVRAGLVPAAHGHPDGDANDTRFVGDLAPVARERADGPRLRVVDGGSCDLTQTAHLPAEPGDGFVARYHPTARFEPDPGRPSRDGRDRRGRAYAEDWGRLGSPRNEARRYVLRTILERTAERDGVLVTGSCDGAALPAADVLGRYLMGWASSGPPSG